MRGGRYPGRGDRAEEDSLALALVFPKRSAHAAISGYLYHLYQTCLGVLRWLDLADDEVLVCEGDEAPGRVTSGSGARTGGRRRAKSSPEFANAAR
jgi:hypothetical protein